MKKLEIGNFHVKDIVFGEKTSFHGGVLTVNKEEALACVDPDGALKNLELYIVHPGDSTRILPVKAAVEPRYRPDGRAIFPGFTGPVARCGEGVLYAMKDMTVLLCGKYAISSDGLIDMSGPAAKQSIFSKMVHLVLYAEKVDEADIDEAFRYENDQKRAAYLLAEYVAKTLAGQEPEEWECYELEPGAKEAEEKGLPRVAYFYTAESQYPTGCCDEILGGDTQNLMPVLVHPNAVLDGQLVSMTGMMGDSFFTYSFQNHPLLKRLYREHGKTLNFMGVVVCPCDASNEVKLRVKVCAGELASMLKLDGAVVASQAGGSNFDVDFFFLIAEMEDRGIKTVGYTGEHNGKSMLDPKADAIVVGGDSGSIFELPPMDFVIGDLQSAVRDFYFGSWSVHDKYGPSLRPDGSLIVNGCMISDCTNNNGFTTKTVIDY